MKQSNSTDTSGFLNDGNGGEGTSAASLLPIDHSFTGWEEVYASAEGFTRLFCCRRYGRLHILKVLKEEYRGVTLYEQALRKEFDIAYSLDHPHICRIMAMEALPDWGNAIVMEYVDGMTLGDWMDSPYCTEGEAYKVACELCDTLEYLHRRQLVHRDLKPANILITHQGQHVKLIDFGLADGDEYEVLKGPAGTLRYMAPEAMRNDGHPDLRADLYSLGVILGELAGRIGDRRMHDVARRCMAHKPEERYASATGVMAALRQASEKKPFHFPWMATLFGILLLLVTMGTIFYLWKDGGEGTAEDADNVLHLVMPDTASVDSANRPSSGTPMEGNPLQSGERTERLKLRTADWRAVTQSHPFYAEAQKLLAGNLKEEDAANRRLILDYVEHLRTAYTTKDIDFLEQVFSEKALIIVGTVVKTVADSENHFLSPAQVTYNVRTKHEYMGRLRRLFASNSHIDLEFSDFKVMRHPTRKGIYGVTLRQAYRSDRYADDGYLFLLWDFRDPMAPMIHVRTWQPYWVEEGQPLPVDEVYDLGSFNLE